MPAVLTVPNDLHPQGWHYVYLEVEDNINVVQGSAATLLKQGLLGSSAHSPHINIFFLVCG
jgi:hypothetical protein